MGTPTGEGGTRRSAIITGSLPGALADRLHFDRPHVLLEKGDRIYRLEDEQSPGTVHYKLTVLIVPDYIAYYAITGYAPPGLHETLREEAERVKAAGRGYGSLTSVRLVYPKKQGRPERGHRISAHSLKGDTVIGFELSEVPEESARSLGGSTGALEDSDPDDLAGGY